MEYDQHTARGIDAIVALPNRVVIMFQELQKKTSHDVQNEIHSSSAEFWKSNLFYYVSKFLHYNTIKTGQNEKTKRHPTPRKEW